MDIVCDKKTNEHMHDRVLFSQVLLIIQCMPWKFPDQ